ncbi:MAG: hypothetical protein WD154_01755 [Nitrosopumilaceae archaeon]
MQKKSVLVISSIIAIVSIGVFAMVFSFSYPSPNYRQGLILPEDETALSVVMAKAKQLGISNIMEAVDSYDLSSIYSRKL